MLTDNWIIEDFSVFENMHLGFFTVFVNVTGPFDRGLAYREN